VVKLIQQIITIVEKNTIVEKELEQFAMMDQHPEQLVLEHAATMME
jgi:hypothetical protein